MTDPRAHRVLASVTRVAVLEVLRTTGRPLRVLELADRMGLHANTGFPSDSLLSDAAAARGGARTCRVARCPGDPAEPVAVLQFDHHVR